MKRISRGKLIWLCVCALLLVGAGACALGARSLSRSLLSQREAERWRGENELSFAQISCFLSADSPATLSDIYSFRYAMLDEFTAVGIEFDAEKGLYPFIDAWSCEDKLSISCDRASTEAPVTAVGGHFFEFHPLRLLDGGFISEDDLSPDRVVLDNELAWELFGGTDLAGMRVNVSGTEFVVAGVVEREDDAASRSAYPGEKGFFISYDAYRALSGRDAVSCYEVVMPDVVKGYAASVVASHFKLDGGESVVNSDRFELGRLLGIARDLPSRAAHSGKVSYPYWENAARINENKCAVLVSAALLLSLPAAITALAELVRLLVRGKRALETTLLPRFRDSAEEAVRVRARRRWEKKHGADAD